MDSQQGSSGANVPQYVMTDPQELRSRLLSPTVTKSEIYAVMYQMANYEALRKALGLKTNRDRIAEAMTDSDPKTLGFVLFSILSSVSLPDVDKRLPDERLPDSQLATFVADHQEGEDIVNTREDRLRRLRKDYHKKVLKQYIANTRRILGEEEAKRLEKRVEPELLYTIEHSTEQTLQKNIERVLSGHTAAALTVQRVASRFQHSTTSEDQELPYQEQTPLHLHGSQDPSEAVLPVVYLNNRRARPVPEQVLKNPTYYGRVASSAKTHDSFIRGLKDSDPDAAREIDTAYKTASKEATVLVRESLDEVQPPEEVLVAAAAHRRHTEANEVLLEKTYLSDKSPSFQKPRTYYRVVLGSNTNTQPKEPVRVLEKEAEVTELLESHLPDGDYSQNLFTGAASLLPQDVRDQVLQSRANKALVYLLETEAGAQELVDNLGRSVVDSTAFQIALEQAKARVDLRQESGGAAGGLTRAVSDVVTTVTGAPTEEMIVYLKRAQEGGFDLQGNPHSAAEGLLILSVATTEPVGNQVELDDELRTFEKRLEQAAITTTTSSAHLPDSEKHGDTPHPPHPHTPDFTQGAPDVSRSPTGTKIKKSISPRSFVHRLFLSRFKRQSPAAFAQAFSLVLNNLRALVVQTIRQQAVNLIKRTGAQAAYEGARRFFQALAARFFSAGVAAGAEATAVAAGGTVAAASGPVGWVVGIGAAAAGFLKGAVSAFTRSRDAIYDKLLEGRSASSYNFVELVIILSIAAIFGFVIIAAGPSAFVDNLGGGGYGGAAPPPFEDIGCDPSQFNCAWPTTGRIVQGPYTNFTHKGSAANAIDIAAATGTEIIAPFSGVVTASFYGCRDGSGYRGNRCGNGYGNSLTLRGADGTEVRFTHISDILNYPTNVQQQLRLSPGTQVSQGQVIALVDQNGNSDIPHLHYQMESARHINTILPFSVPSCRYISGSANCCTVLAAEGKSCQVSPQS